MNKKILLFLYLLLPISILAHGESEAQVMGFDARILWIAAVLIIIFVIAGILYRNPKAKKFLFTGLVAVTLLSVGYLVTLNTYWVLTSESDGPVHWHADFEIEICGEEIEIPHSEGIEGRVGTSVLHHHNDNRIHVEGILIKLKEADLGHFFEAIGGELTDTSITLPDGRTYKNGDMCPNGKPSYLNVYVNGEKIEHPDEYVISPYSKVPPGDIIEIEFTDLVSLHGS